MNITGTDGPVKNFPSESSTSPARPMTRRAPSGPRSPLVESATCRCRPRTLGQVPDSALDALPDAPGLRAVRAKVHAEASSMCPTCGRRHLLDSHCSAAPEVVHDVDPPPVETAPEPDALEDATTPTRSDTAREGDNGSARSRLRSVVAYLGLDAASFGDVGDDAPGAAASSEVAGS